MYKKLKEALEELGLKSVFEGLCVLLNGKVIVFFFVGDIIMMFYERHQDKWQRVESLRTTSSSQGPNETSWFLKVRITKDQPNCLIWLSQGQYVGKVARCFELTEKAYGQPTTSLALSVTLKLATKNDELDKAGRLKYQAMVRSIIYASIMIRPEVAKDAAVLSRFSHNPGIAYEKAANTAFDNFLVRPFWLYRRTGY